MCYDYACILLSWRIKIKHNYLNNRDILKAIHASKSSYCSYLTPDAADYDIIIHAASSINAETITQAKINRAVRLARAALDLANTVGAKKKMEEFAIDPDSILDTEVVIRLMTWDHVPIDDIKTKKAEAALAEITDNDILHTEYDEIDTEPKVSASTTRYVKCNFPPFKHYKLDTNGVAVCVGHSHWKGDLVTGVWCRDHGAMTKTLALMFMKLCERYATRSNWRGYTYNDEMRSQALLQLSQIGLQFDESKSDNPFAYYTATVTNSFTRVLNIEKRNQNIRDDILEMNNVNPSYTRQGMGSPGVTYEE